MSQKLLRSGYDPVFASAVRRLEKRLLCEGGQIVAIYGMGQHSRDLIENLDLKPCCGHLLGFFSDDPLQAADFCGYPVLSKREALKQAERIVLSSDAFEKQMRQRLMDEGFKGSILEMYGLNGIASYDSAECGEVLALDNAATFTLRFDRFAAEHGIDLRRLQSQEVLNEKRAEATLWMNDYEDSVLLDLSFEGIRLLEVARGTLACLLNRANLEWEDDLPVIRACLRDTVAYLMGFKEIFSRSSRTVQTLLVSNGHWNDVWAAAIMARRAGINVVATELSFFPQLVYVEHITGRVANNTWLAEHAAVYLRDRVLSPAQQNKVRSFFSNRKPEQEIRKDHFGQPRSENTTEIRERLGIPAGKRVIIALMQVASDTTIVYDNPLYSDNITFVDDLIPWLKDHPEWVLVIKPHPKELAGLAARGKTPLDNITYRRLQKSLAFHSLDNVILTTADETNIYSLFNIADFAVTINSQSGLEFSAQTHRRTLALGKAAYGQKGFTVDVSDREFVAPALDLLAARTVLNDSEINRMECFLYHMLFEYLYPVTWATDAVRSDRLRRILQGEKVCL